MEWNQNLRAHALFPTLTELYLADGEANRIASDGTRVAKRSVLRLLQAFAPDKRANEFTEDDLVAFLGSRSLAPTALRKYRNDIQSFFAWASFRGFVVPSPAEHLDRLIRPKKIPTKVHRWLSRLEVERLLATCSGEEAVRDHRDHVLLKLAVLTGLRKFELIGLRWSDIDFNGGGIYVLGKGGKPAVVGMPSPLEVVLQRWRERYAKAVGHPVGVEPVLVGCRVIGGAGGHSVRHVVARWGVKPSLRTVDIAVRERGERAGVPQLAPHDLRRTFAGLLEEAGTPLLDISKALRHENVATTSTYLGHNVHNARGPPSAAWPKASRSPS